MIEEAKKLLAQFVEMSGDDEDKKNLASRYQTDIELVETTTELKKSEHYTKMIADLEKANETNQESILNANTVKTPPEVIVQVIVEFQANRRVINSMKGPDIAEVIDHLNKSIETLKEEKEYAEGQA